MTHLNCPCGIARVDCTYHAVTSRHDTLRIHLRTRIRSTSRSIPAVYAQPAVVCTPDGNFGISPVDGMFMMWEFCKGIYTPYLAHAHLILNTWHEIIVTDTNWCVDGVTPSSQLEGSRSFPQHELIYGTNWNRQAPLDGDVEVLTRR